MDFRVEEKEKERKEKKNRSQMHFRHFSCFTSHSIIIQKMKMFDKI